MAKHKSALKQMRHSRKRQAINKKTKSAVRSEVRKAREALHGQGPADAQKHLPDAYAMIDRAVKKGAIHKNKGRRLKSRLSRQIARTNAPAAK